MTQQPPLGGEHQNQGSPPVCRQPPLPRQRHLPHCRNPHAGLAGIKAPAWCSTFTHFEWPQHLAASHQPCCPCAVLLFHPPRCSTEPIRPTWLPPLPVSGAATWDCGQVSLGRAASVTLEGSLMGPAGRAAQPAATLGLAPVGSPAGTVPGAAG